MSLGRVGQSKGLGQELGSGYPESGGKEKIPERKVIPTKGPFNVFHLNAGEIEGSESKLP